LFDKKISTYLICLLYFIHNLNILQTFSNYAKKSSFFNFLKISLILPIPAKITAANNQKGIIITSNKNNKKSLVLLR